MGLLRFGSPLRDMFEVNSDDPIPTYHKRLIESLTETPKTMSKRAKRRARGRLKQQRREGVA